MLELYLNLFNFKDMFVQSGQGKYGNRLVILSIPGRHQFLVPVAAVSVT